MCRMKQVPIHQAAKTLSSLLQAGEPIQLTRYNRVVAIITPLTISIEPDGSISYTASAPLQPPIISTQLQRIAVGPITVTTKPTISSELARQQQAGRDDILRKLPRNRWHRC